MMLSGFRIVLFRVNGREVLGKFCFFLWICLWSDCSMQDLLEKDSRIKKGNVRICFERQFVKVSDQSHSFRLHGNSEGFGWCDIDLFLVLIPNICTEYGCNVCRLCMLCSAKGCELNQLSHRLVFLCTRNLWQWMNMKALSKAFEEIRAALNFWEELKRNYRMSHNIRNGMKYSSSYVEVPFYVRPVKLQWFKKVSDKPQSFRCCVNHSNSQATEKGNFT